MVGLKQRFDLQNNIFWTLKHFIIKIDENKRIYERQK